MGYDIFSFSNYFKIKPIIGLSYLHYNELKIRSYSPCFECIEYDYYKISTIGLMGGLNSEFLLLNRFNFTLGYRYFWFGQKKEYGFITSMGYQFSLKKPATKL